MACNSDDDDWMLMSFICDVMIMYPDSLAFFSTGSDVNDKRCQGNLDIDGFPPIGTVLQPGDPLYRYSDALWDFEQLISVRCNCEMMLCGGVLDGAQQTKCTAAVLCRVTRMFAQKSKPD